MAGKSLLLVCTYGDSGPDTARFTVGMLETAARYLGMRFLPPLVVSTPSAARRRPTAPRWNRRVAPGQRSSGGEG